MGYFTVKFVIYSKKIEIYNGDLKLLISTVYVYISQRQVHMYILRT